MLSLVGDIDLSTVPLVHQALAQLVDDHRAQVVAVDLDGVVTMDDVGFGIVLGAAGRARDHGGDLVIVCSGGRLRDRLSLTGLDRAVTVHPSASAAARAAAPAVPIPPATVVDPDR